MSGAWVRVIVNGCERESFAIRVATFAAERNLSISLIPDADSENSFSILNDDVPVLVSYLQTNGIQHQPADVERIREFGSMVVTVLPEPTPDQSDGSLENSFSVSQVVTPQVSFIREGAVENLELGVTREVTNVASSRPDLHPDAGELGEDIKGLEKQIASSASVKSRPIREAAKEAEYVVSRQITRFGELVEPLTQFMLRSGLQIAGNLRQEILSAWRERCYIRYRIAETTGKALIGKYLREVVFPSLESFSDAGDTEREITKLSEALFGVEDEEFVKFAQNGVKNTFEEYYRFMKQFVVSYQEFRDSLKRLFEVERKIRFLGETVLKLVDGGFDFVRNQVVEQISLISSFSFVKGMSITPEGKLQIYYDNVDLVYDDRLWPLGEYCFEIDLDLFEKAVIDYRESNTVPTHYSLFQLRNLSIPLTSNDYDTHHPHITAGGRSICWGNIREGVYKLLVEFNLPVLVSLVWEYLHTYNPADRYCDIAVLFERWGRRPRELRSEK